MTWVHKQLWSHITQAQEDHARKALNRFREVDPNRFRYLNHQDPRGRLASNRFSYDEPREITASLAEFGFHWNNLRQTWQHPCGTLTEGTPFEPRKKYGSRFATKAT